MITRLAVGRPMFVRPTDRKGVFTDGSWLYTRNLVSGRSVYGEALRTEGRVEYRRWDAERSKLAAYLQRGGDAARPESYQARVGHVDVLDQDLAQRDQEGIFPRNAGFLRPGGTGFLMLKARSADVSAHPREVYAAAPGTPGEEGPRGAGGPPPGPLA